MLKIFFKLALIFSFIAATQAAEYANIYPIPKNGDLKKVITPWNSEKGIELFETAKYKKDFYHLAHLYQPQRNPLYCGIATSAIILNAMNIEKNKISNSKNIVTRPDKKNKIIDFHYYTQDDILNKNTEKIKERNVIDFKIVSQNGQYDPGLTLKNLEKILESHKVNADIYYADDDLNYGTKQFRNILKKHLNNKYEYIIANFYGKKIGATTNGHISPIVAFNEEEDKILILDVASHKNPWYWVETPSFYKAMQEKDGKLNRGFLVIN